MRFVGRCTFVVVLVGCEQRDAPAPVSDSPAQTKTEGAPAVDAKAADAKVTAVDDKAAVDAKAGVDAKAPVDVKAPTLWTDDPKQPPGSAFEPTVAATALDRGALAVWSRPAEAEGKSEIVAQALDDEGVGRDVPSLLRTTTGEVVAIAVHHREGDAWVAWIARVGEDPEPRNLVAAMRVASDLSAVAAPITLGQFVVGDSGGDDLRLLDLADGGAAVGASSSPAQCTDAAVGGSTKCPGFDLFWVREDGTFTLAAHFGADGGDAELGSLVDVGTGVVLDAWAWHGGPTYGDAFARYGEASSPAPVDLPECRPPFTRSFTGAEIVTLCDDDYVDEGERCVSTGDEPSCARVHAVRPSGELLTPKSAPKNGTPQLGSRFRCKDGHPVLEVDWDGGSVVLDPTRAGASLDGMFGVWTGTHAVMFASNGARESWACKATGELAIDEHVATPLPFEHPTRELRRVKGKL